MMRGTRAGRCAATLMVFGLVIAGCASDDDRIRDPNAITIPPTSAAPATAGSSAPTSGPPTSGPPTSNGTSVVVSAQDNNFVDKEIEVRAGTEVIWVNQGHNDHDVVPADDLRSITWGAPLGSFAPGDRYSHVFLAPGTYVYVCTIHGKVVGGTAKGMVGVVTVTP